MVTRVARPGRTVVLVVGGVAAAAALLTAHLAVGRLPLPPDDVWAALTGSPTSAFHRVLVVDLRLPRALVGLGAGALLALSGAVLQAVTRNPLAEPGLVGVTTGAALGVVASLAVAAGTGLSPAPTVAALLGGLAAGAATWLVAGRHRSDPGRLVLVGALVAALCTALTSLLLLGRRDSLGSVLRWLVGSLNARTWDDWAALWPWLLAGVPVALLSAGLVNLLQLDDPLVTSLGRPADRTRLLVLGLAVALAAAAVSATGAVAFVGLLAPHVARRLVGADARALLPVAAVLGAVLLSAADLVAYSTTVSLPGAASQVTGLPVGAVTAVVGGPVLLALLRRSRR